MKTVAKRRLYEGMFLVDSGEAASDWEGVKKTIKSMLKKAGSKDISIKKWDERKLAYEIGHKSRGTYILTYFRADGSKIGEIERAVQLSEKIIRVLILNVEDMGQEYIEKETPAMIAERTKRKEKPQEQAEVSDEMESFDDAEAAVTEDLGDLDVELPQGQEDSAQETEKE